MNESGERVRSEYQRRLPGISDGGLVRLIQGQFARISAAQARTLELVAELRGRPSMVAQEGRMNSGTLPREALVEAELRAALGLSAYAAHQLVAAAVALDERMFATMLLLRAGGIDLARVQLIAKHAVPLADHTVRQARSAGCSPREAEDRAKAVIRCLEEMVLPHVRSWSRARLERETIAAVAVIDPAHAQEQQALAVRSRSVSRPMPVPDDPHGQQMNEITARLPRAEAHAVWRTVDKYARTLREQGDERTLPELRADTFTHLVLRGHPPTTVAGRDTAVDWSRTAGFDRYGLRANIDVTVSLETLLGLSEAPGDLGGQPITADLARALAFRPGGTWRRLVTDDHGHLVEHGTTRYTPPDPVKRHVRTRDRFCRTPWCDRPAGACDVDHLVPFPAGPTDAGNLQCKCRRCHRLKHEGRWRHELLDGGSTGSDTGGGAASGNLRDAGLPPGTVRLVSPTGMEYYSAPFNLRRHHQLRERHLTRAEPRAAAVDCGEPPF